MAVALDQLPSDPDHLRVNIAEQVVELAVKDVELRSRDVLVEKLKAQPAALRRPRFGAYSEKLGCIIDQLALTLEEIEAGELTATAETPTRRRPVRSGGVRRPVRAAVAVSPVYPI